MKKILIFTALLFSVCCISGTAAAVSPDTSRIEEAVPQKAREIIGDVSLKNSDFDGLLPRLRKALSEELSGAYKPALKSGAAVLAISAVCAVIGTVNVPSRMPDFVLLAGALAVSAVAVGSVSSLMALAVETIYELETFSKALLPTLAAAGTASGAAMSASAKYLAASLFTDILITVSSRVVIPLISAYLAASIADAAVDGASLRGVANIIKWVSVTVMTAVNLIFVSYLTVTGIIASSADAVTMRFAKTAISTALPVVGGILSDAAGVVMSGAAAMRNAVGLLGLAVMCAVCLAPFIKLAVYMLVYKAASALASPITDIRIAKLLGDIGTAYGMMLGLVGSVCIMLFVSVVSATKAVTG